MMHLAPFRARTVLTLAPATEDGWQLKRYAILAKGRTFAPDIAEAATTEAFNRLPPAGQLSDADGNHGIGFQIIHFAETAVVSPVFFWQWGSVLAHIDQLRAPWTDPTQFGSGKAEIFGCIWEMDIVTFEVQAWTRTLLGDQGTPATNFASYMTLAAA